VEYQQKKCHTRITHYTQLYHHSVTPCQTWFDDFVMALNKDGKAFRYLLNMFLKLANAKIKEEVFDGSQMWKVLSDQHFKDIRGSRMVGI